MPKYRDVHVSRKEVHEYEHTFRVLADATDADVERLAMELPDDEWDYDFGGDTHLEITDHGEEYEAEEEETE